MLRCTPLLGIDMSIYTHTSARGFTLVEAVMYIGLFSLLLSSSLVVVWQLVDGMQRDMQRLTIQEEGNFVMQKIHRSVIDSASVAVLNEDFSHQIILHTHAAQRITVRFNMASSSIEMQRGQLAPFVPLTTNAVRVNDVVFTEMLHAGAPGIRATITIEGEVFEVEEYVRD